MDAVHENRGVSGGRRQQANPNAARNQLDHDCSYLRWIDEEYVPSNSSDWIAREMTAQTWRTALR